MTTKEFFENLSTAEVVTDEMRTFATTWLEKNAASQMKRAAAIAEKRKEKDAANAPIRDAIVACITDEPKTATTLIEEAGVEITPQSVPSLLKPLFEAGKISKVAIKVPGKGNRVGYTL